MPSPAGLRAVLPGPVGERNEYRLDPRGEVLCVPRTEAGMTAQIGAALAAGNRVRLVASGALRGLADGLPSSVLARLTVVREIAPGPWGVALVEGADPIEACAAIAAVPGPVRPVFVTSGAAAVPLEFLLAERSVSINTAAAGGNASLMSLE